MLAFIDNLSLGELLAIAIGCAVFGVNAARLERRGAKHPMHGAGDGAGPR